MILYTIVVAFQQKSDPEESPEEIKSREMELGIESWTLSFASVVPQQQCYKHCPCDYVPHSS